MHPVYMPPKARTRRMQSANPKRQVLRWRANHIGEWREDAEMTQQDVADRLKERGIDLDRVSIGRIEGGKQVTSIEVLEAMASLFGTDVTTMTDHAPAEGRELQKIRSLDAAERRRFFRMFQASKDDGE